MKSFNWGQGITLAITLFVIATLSVVSYLISLDFYLVNNNHYEEGVNYQQTIDSRARTEALEQPVIVLYDEERIAVKVVFPEDVVQNAQQGTINLYRPNDSNLDMNLPIKFDGGSTHVIPMERMEKGKWVLTINWTMNDLDYITEKVIII